ncbi:TPA: winged helix-turn-helix domain-containing protein [Escherichia coli]
MKTPGMTGKEIILRYLETHARFSAPELVEKLGVKRTVINQAAGKMVREGVAGCGRVHEQDNALPEANGKGTTGTGATG